MRQPDILIFVEHVARELEIACLIRHLAARAGVDVTVASIHYDLHTAIARYRPALIATPCFASAADANLGHLVSAFPGATYVNLAFEQLLSRGNRAAKRPADRIAREHVLHLASGPAYREFLSAHGVPRRNIAVVGSLPLGLYRPPYRHLVDGQRQRLAHRYGLDASRPWVFLPENYSAAFLTDREIRQRIARGFDRDDVYTYRDHAGRSLQAVARWCWHVADGAAVELIIRPRPATDTTELVRACCQAAGREPPGNLHFIKEETVREWNLASDLVATSYSTAGLEAAVCGKPVYQLLPEALPPFMAVDWLAYAPSVTSAADFLHLARSAADLEPNRALDDWARSHLMGTDDSLALTSRLLTDIVTGRRSAPPPPGGRPRTFVRMATALRHRVRALRSRRASRSTRYEMDRFSQHDVDRRTARWADLFGRPALEAAETSRPKNVPDPFVCPLAEEAP
ncbi:MAG: hypothetical protein ACC645_15790 [Pirellulales bacterium]